jgi:hypothetical protein
VLCCAVCCVRVRRLHDRSTGRLTKHMELDVVDLGVQGFILEKFRNQVPHIVAEAPQILLRCLRQENNLVGKITSASRLEPRSSL